MGCICILLWWVGLCNLYYGTREIWQELGPTYVLTHVRFFHVSILYAIILTCRLMTCHVTWKELVFSFFDWYWNLEGMNPLFYMGSAETLYDLLHGAFITPPSKSGRASNAYWFQSIGSLRYEPVPILVSSFFRWSFVLDS
jgi:hypothetical protein